ncbi:MAG: sodium:alanine symporter family protein [Clostridiaceae bacterium]|nr:sodium:alanine symporter family protein [Clostridiaceae bacterium]
MPQSIVNFVNTATGIIWGPAMLFLLVGGGLFISFRIGFVQIRHFRYMMSQTFGSLFRKNTSKGTGTITPFQAVTSELASTVGAANIVGVPVAIFFGGPGAVFWMWMTAVVGMGTKFAEIVLGIMYREKDEKGNYVSGPMYYLRNGLKSPKLATIYSFLFMITILCGIMVQANSAAGSAVTLGISPTVSGIVITIFVGLIVVGGISRIGKISEKFVPFMAGFYILGCLFIILGNLGTVPAVFALIMRDAFTGHAAVGGFAGSTIVMAMRFGTARGAYSNEAGMGSAPIAHAASQTDHPVRQGLWGMFSVFMDTIVICSMTAFVVLSSGVWQETGIEASAMTALAFTSFYGPIGGLVVSIAVLLFVISTIYVILYYGETIANYLFGYKFSIFMRFVYLAACFIGAIGGMKFLWLFLDLLFGLAVIPNMIGLLLLSGVVASQTKEFFTGDEFYLKDVAVKKDNNLKA